MSHSRREVRDQLTVTMLHLVAVGLVKLLGSGHASRRPVFATPVQH